VASEVTVLSEGTKDEVGAAYQKTSEHLVAVPGDALLWITLLRLVFARNQTQVSPHLPTLFEASRVLQSEHSPLLVPTLKAVAKTLGRLPEQTSVHLDRGYDSKLTRERLEELGLEWEISGKGKPAPFWASRRWVVERASSWHNAHKKLVWCTKRVGRVIDFGCRSPTRWSS